MRFLNPATRRLIPAVVFAMLLANVVVCWSMMRFVHLDAQYRLLAPEHYKVQVVTAADYRRLADPSNRNVVLSDGTQIHKAPIWDEVVLPRYKLTDDGRSHVLVTTKGTAHCLPYVSGYFLIFGFLAACGLLASLWNLKQKG
jgi:hypothetical protein